jgi:hypothetical protein
MTPGAVDSSIWSKNLGLTAGVPRGDEIAIVAYLREAQSIPALRDPEIMARNLQWSIERINLTLAALVAVGIATVDFQLVEAWRTAPKMLKDPVGAARTRKSRAKKRGNLSSPDVTCHDGVMTRHAESLIANDLAESAIMKPVKALGPGWVQIGKAIQHVGPDHQAPVRSTAPGNPDKPFKDKKNNFAFQVETARRQARSRICRGLAPALNIFQIGRNGAGDSGLSIPWPTLNRGCYPRNTQRCLARCPMRRCGNGF